MWSHLVNYSVSQDANGNFIMNFEVVPNTDVSYTSEPGRVNVIVLRPGTSTDTHHVKNFGNHSPFIFKFNQPSLAKSGEFIEDPTGTMGGITTPGR